MLLMYGGRKRATVEQDSVHELAGLAAFTPKLSQQEVLELQFSTWRRQHESSAQKLIHMKDQTIYRLQLSRSIVNERAQIFGAAAHSAAAVRERGSAIM